MTAQILIGALLIGDTPTVLPAREVSLASSAHVDSQHHPIRTPHTPLRVTLTVPQQAEPYSCRPRSSTVATTDSRCRAWSSTLFHPPIRLHITPPGA